VSKGEGKTVVFVSHDISNLTKICNKGIILDKAKITLIDSIWEATDKYLQNNISNLSNQPISGINIVVENFGFDKLNFKKETNSLIGNNVNIYLEFYMLEKIDGFSISIDIRNKKNELIAHIINEDDDFYLETNKLTKYQIELSINNINLINDTYFIDLWFGSFHSESLLRIERCLKLNILTSEIIKRRTPLPKHSKVFLESKWKNYDF
jgi:lipopolysaccharide transport system ATP-binding protein